MRGNITPRRRSGRFPHRFGERDQIVTAGGMRKISFVSNQLPPARRRHPAAVNFT